MRVRTFLKDVLNKNIEIKNKFRNKSDNFAVICSFYEEILSTTASSWAPYNWTSSPS